MSKKVRVALVCGLIGVFIILTIGISGIVLHYRNSESSVHVSADETDPTYSETLPHESYNDITLESPEEHGTITYNVPILENVDETRFANALLSRFPDGLTVLGFNGGRYGVFYVQVESGGITYDGVYVDGESLWYDSVEDYNAQAED